MEAGEIKKSFTKRYVIAISLIAMLSTMAFYFLFLALKASDSTALIVNISGKQRMLSQQITSLSEQYYLQTYIKKNPVESQVIRQKLANLTIEMSSANKALSSGEIKEGIHLKLSPSIKEHYFGSVQLKNRVDEYINISENIISFSTQHDTLFALEKLLKKSEMLLPALNQVVLQYQKEGEENITNIQHLEMLVWILTLLVLLLEVIFIFQPMANRIAELFREVNYHTESLEQQVRLRTLGLELANKKLTELASHDPLTGLKNRLNLENELKSLLIHYQKNHVPFAVVMFDIDWFKKINDNHGHDVGDFILRELSQVLRSSIRNEDSAYRVGGEEFVVVFNRISLLEVKEKVDLIRQVVEAHHFQTGDYNLNITISGGIYHPDKIELSDTKMIMKAVDDALYRSKRSGRNQITVAESNIVDIFLPLAPSKTLIKISDDGHILYVDFDIGDLLGYKHAYFKEGNINLNEMIHKDDLDWLLRLKKNEPLASTLRFYKASGETKIIKIDGFKSELDVWNLELQDPIALAKSVEDELLVENFEAMMNRTDDFIYFKDNNHVFIAGSQTLVDLTNVGSREELVGKTGYEVFPAELANKYFKLEREVYCGEIDIVHEIQLTLDKNGNKKWVDNRKYPIKNSAGEIIGLFGIARVLKNDGSTN